MDDLDAFALRCRPRGRRLNRPLHGRIVLPNARTKQKQICSFFEDCGKWDTASVGSSKPLFKGEAFDRSTFLAILIDFRPNECYTIGMSAQPENATATRIRSLARKYQVAYVRTQSDALANHITRLAGDHVELDEVEQLLIALQRAGHLSRAELVRLQASYLREAKP